jgi:hypothetical protein
MQRRWVGALRGMIRPIGRGLVGGVLLMLAGGLGAAFGSGGQPASAVAPRSVVVVLRDQFRATPDTAGRAAARSADVADAQATLLNSVAATGGTVTRRYHLLDAFAATVSPGEQAALARDPAVSAVYPNVTFRVAEPQPVSSSVAAGSVAGAPLADAPQTGSVVCGTAADPLLEPEALALTHTAPSTLDGSTAGYETSTGVTGAGVAVGEITDGLDPNNPDLMRNGSSIVTEVDFSGNGVDAPSPGGEAFADAGSIAAQGNVTYDLSERVPGNPQLGGAGSGCDMRIRGVAPGASLYVLKAFGQGDYTTTEDIIAAIDYAVSTAHVNVLNESLGIGQLPDDVEDAIRLADEQAYAAGVTVVASSGDVGPFDAQESPSTDPDVIAVAASTSNRVDAQLGNYGAGLATFGEGFQGGTIAAPDGWLDDSPAGFSSSGIDEAGGVPDLIAPGDEWILCSTNSAMFSGCPAEPTEFIGTSVSSPLTAGAAALVIQAYAQTHGGSHPSPALVKQILMSTADDIGVPSQEQGAGMLDTFAAVQAARSPSVGVGGTGTSPAQTGVLVSTSSNVATPDVGGPRPGQIDLSASAGASTSATIDVTNTGSRSEIVTPALRGLTRTLSQTSGQVDLNGTSGAQPTFNFGDTSTHTYQSWTFAVPSGTSELREQASWADQQGGVQLSVFDPSGRYAGTTNLSNEGLLDVAQPQAGTWTGVVFTGAGSTAYNGSVHYSSTASAFTTPAAVSPAALTLAPGAQGSFTVPLTLPAAAGDESEDVTLSTALASAPGVVLSTDVVPVALRALVALAGAEGTFSGTAEGDGDSTFGSNGFATYTFDVPAGAPALTVDLTLPGDTNTPVGGYLVDPQGEPLSVNDNTITNAGGTTLGYGSTVQDVALAPQAGLWRYVVAVTVPADGSASEGTYNGTVTLSSPVTVTTTSVPESTNTYIAPGATTTGMIHVVNAGATNQLIFVDPRSQTLGQIPLAANYGAGDSVALPFLDADQPVSFLVPPDTTALNASTQALSTGGQPLAGATFDLAPLNDGDPDLGSTVSDAVSGTSTATLGVSSPLPQVAQGWWVLTPSLAGPFGTAATVPTGTASASVLADTLGFDTSVTSSTGDRWLASINSAAPTAQPLSVAPGGSGPISVSFTPSVSTPTGTVVSGTLYVDDYFNDSGSGDQLAAVPYTYTVGTAPPTTTTSTPTTPTPPATPPSPSGTVTPPVGSTRPAATVATGVRSTARKLSTGVASLRLPLSATCASSASGRCRVSVTATVPGALAGSRARTVTIGSGSLTVAARQSAIVPLRLTTRGIKLLRTRHTLTITLHVAISTPGSSPYARTVTLRLTYTQTKRRRGSP